MMLPLDCRGPVAEAALDVVSGTSTAPGRERSSSQRSPGQVGLHLKAVRFAQDVELVLLSPAREMLFVPGGQALRMVHGSAAEVE
jgi:hypothetical protein